jgi:triosephosphate isomerase
MRKQIAAANWKMNLTYSEGASLLKNILSEGLVIRDNQQVIFAVPFPYLVMAEVK